MEKMPKIASLMTALLLAACQAGVSGASQTTDNSGNSSNSSSSKWILVAGKVKGKPLNTKDGKITLIQEKDAFTGVSAINHYRVPVKIHDGRIEHTEPPTTTLMAGPAGAMRLERDYLDAISVVKTLKHESDRLTISGDGIELQFRPAP